MSERKNLDKLFQEKFKDFEAIAPEQSWPYIEEKLKEKMKRRVIPLWWKLSGIAAALLLGLILYEGWKQSKSDAVNTNQVVVNDRPASQSGNGISGNGISGGIDGDSTQSVTQNENQNDGALSNRNETIEKNAIQNKTGKQNINAIVANDPHQKQKSASISQPNNPSQNNYLTPKQTTEEQLVNSGNRGEKPDLKRNFHKPTIQQQLSEGISKAKQLALNRSLKKNQKSPHPKTAQALANLPLQKSVSSGSLPKADLGKTHDAETGIAQQNQFQQPKDAKVIGDADRKQPIALHTENPSKVNIQDKKLDSAAVATAVPNALEELLNEKENNLVTKGPQINRWQITSSVAPIYFGSASGGSPIDSSFAGHSKSYKTNMSVKLGVNYAVNKKWTLRAGVSQVTFDYNTNNVLMYAGLDQRPLGNVNTSGESQYLHFGRKARAVNAVIANTSELSTDKFQSYVNQRMGYIEVPVEVSYAILNKKLGLNIIGGISTLFLNENKILVVSSGMTTNLGEANNLSKTHFSSNVGLGVRYRFYRAFQANFEPMFKYQINTFSKDAGNFKPYYLGLYTGISYSF